jgi:RNA polymerase sigma factor (sigma-70 family)
MSAATQLLSILRRLPSATPDTDLVRDYVAGRGEEPFRQLVVRHGQMVMRICRHLLTDSHAAEDAFQATFLILARKAVGLHRPEALAAWLYGVARRVCTKARRATARRCVAEAHAAPRSPADPVADLSARELLTALDGELVRLPPRYQEPLRLLYWQGMTHADAARRLGLSAGALHGRLDRGRKRLADRLRRRGFVPDSTERALLLAASGTAAIPADLLARTTALAAAPWSKALPAAVVAMAVAASPSKLVPLLAVVVVLVGAGVVGLAVGTTQPPESPPPDAPPVAVASPPLVDHFGDALPDGALARLGTVRFRHASHACAIAFAPDGRSLASSGFHAVLHIWESSSGKELLRFESDRRRPGDFECVNGLAYSLDGLTLAGARTNLPACLWDATTGRELRRFEARARWVVFSPDGKTLASGAGHVGGGAEDPDVRLADVATGKDVQVFGGHKGLVARAAFAPDGKALLTADDEGIHRCDIASGERRPLGQSDGERIRFSSVALSPVGKTLAAASHANKLLRLVDASSGAVRWSAALPAGDEYPHATLFTPDGQTVVTGHTDGFVRLWSAADGAKVREFRAHDSRILALAVSPDSRTLATSSESIIGGDHSLRLWETATGRPVVRHPAPQEAIYCVVFSPDSRHVATSDGAGTDLWEAATGRLIHHWSKYGGPLAFTADDRTLVGGGRKKVQFLDVATGSESREFPVPANSLRELALSGDGKLLVTAGNDHFLRLWDTASGRLVHDFGGKLANLNYRVALSPDSKLLASVEHHAVRLLEMASGKLVRELPEAANATVGNVAFSPDGLLLASTVGTTENGQHVGFIRLREVSTGREIRQCRGEGDAMDRIAFSPDGRALIWGGQHHSDLVVWEVASGQVRQRLRGHQAHLCCVAVSPNGRMFASGSEDSTALIWDATGRRRSEHSARATLTAAQLDQAWTELAADDAGVAYQAICTFRESPTQATQFLGRHLKPVPPADPKRLAEAVRDLDSEQFAVRQRATQELERLGPMAEPGLRKVVAGQPSAEVLRRVNQLLARLEGPERLRSLRAVEVLEFIETADARALVTTWAAGVADAPLTKEAAATLDRLRKRSPASAP